MPRMTKDDDPEAYIEAFERTAIQTGLDRSQWGHQLSSLVIDEAQAAYRALSREEAQDYEAIKAAILYRLEISPESYRQAFRARKPRESKRPRGLLQTLRDALQKWLPVGKFDCAGVLDQILLEQFLWDLEEDTQRVALDVIGPLPKSHNGYQYILVLVDYATRFPEAVPLGSITAPKVAEELLKWIAWVGILQEILTDQGTNFMSGVMKALCKTLGITQLRTLVYHPQTNGLVERLNGTIKRLLRHCAQEDPRWWDTLLTPLLFALRDAPQESTHYSPFQLVYGHSPSGLLQVVREEWERPMGLGVSAEEYRRDLQDRIQKAQRIT
ncbi:zinc finger protein 287-like [Alligator mississippiensis]|uniref:Zinc finger protein 287-like n=1 Tax=Alligator mississippiensis TaxID=8496 RepID=A0A151NSJ7_ALLMI|nr:zinc finger protein 287-like [Alligator mississippiensis]